MIYDGRIVSFYYCGHFIYLFICCSIAPQSATKFMGSTMYLPNTNFPDFSFNVVWKVLRIVYAAEDKNGPHGSLSSSPLPSTSAALNASLSVKGTLSIIPLD
jgi:hypothetical protein